MTAPADQDPTAPSTSALVLRADGDGGAVPRSPVERALILTVEQACRPGSWAAVLDWAGLADRPLASISQVAAGHGKSPRNLYGHLAVVRRVAAALVFQQEVWSEASRPTTVGEDQEVRRRQAWLLAGPVPEEPPPMIGPLVGVELAEQRGAWLAAEILAAVGPLPIADLVGGVQRAKLRRRVPVDSDRLVDLLVARGFAQIGRGGQVTGLGKGPAKAAHVALVAAAHASGRTRHSTVQVHELFHQADGPVRSARRSTTTRCCNM